MRKVDLVVIGGGIAGSLLTQEAINNGLQVLLIDNASVQSASGSAAGLTNPITGKRLVKSWNIDQLLDISRKTYTHFEQQLNIKILHNSDIARVIPNDDIFQQWQTNFLAAASEGFIDPEVRTLNVKGLKPFPYFKILKGFWLDVAVLLNALKESYVGQNAFLEGNVTYSSIKHNNESVELNCEGQSIEASKVVFAEGATGFQNPFFSNPNTFNLNKGELMDILVSNLELPFILKRNIFMIPLGANLYRVGATYDRSNLDYEQSEEGLSYLQTKLREIGLESYEIKRRKAAIRPATVNRRPIIGQHRELKNLYIFNGFGAKGVSLTPHFVKQFMKHLLHGEALLPEVSPYR